MIRKKRKRIEDILQETICRYISLKYPNVIFNSDLAGQNNSGRKTDKLRSGRGFPDLFIYEPKGNYSGLFLELKKETPYKKNGELKKQQQTELIGKVKVKYDHLKRQSEIHEKLRKKGYSGDFVWTFDKAKIIIDNYMKL